MLDPEEVLSKCAWCNKAISEDVEVFGMGVKLRVDVDLSEYKGNVMPVALTCTDKTINVIVTTDDSDAKKDGKDIMIMTCSMQCSKDLQKALIEDKTLGDSLEEIGLL